MDYIDKQIIALLKKNSRLTNKEIGEKIHLTGQAVGNRVNKLIEHEIIKSFTIDVRYENTQYIRLFMNSTAFSTIERVVNNFEEIETFDKVSGQACYAIVTHFSQDRLNEFIEKISKWARYSVETVVTNKLRNES
ncbi:hypothetical protein FC19_GL001791 [Liquorilactobacillus aquaticus DSM 21051]|uniref:HTH asnC-type domain-containing protein n=1 Tax=Liquorilactobacillus aquaticus DSM 21051 TaxID=1423725 RepID=A0A0R2CVM9_9LACO|nr:AsnC family transcriptional regulator [Liquorilactobacillus aquaticus]KRM95477.1 hypothetical protein FC19_GL001791 [Liquorilactobacillus aquaticus DSM 21051]